MTPFEALRRTRPVAAPIRPALSDPPNFGLLASDSSWRTTWSAIVPGKFSASIYSCLLFVEEFTGYAELYQTDGQGRISAPYLGAYDPLGDRATWTHIVPGLFGSSGFAGLLLYDQAAGYGRFYGSDGLGNFSLLSEYSGWRTSWTHIIAGRFIASSPWSSLFFYDASTDYGEIWATDALGLAGRAPFETFTTSVLSGIHAQFARGGLPIPVFGPSPFTHVLGGDFHWTPGFISEVPTLTDLFFYNAATGSALMYRCADSPDPGVLILAASSNGLPTQAAAVVAGNFGGTGNTDLGFYDRRSGTLNIYSFQDSSDTTATLVLRETQSGLRRTFDQVVPGNYWMSDPEDHWFNDGPPVSSSPFFDPDWRFGTGAFSDFLFYDRAAGLGEFYWHGPVFPLSPLDGYITSQTTQGGALVATGSVLPGESIAFHISSQSAPYSIRIYQQGLFAGEPEKFVAEIAGLPAEPVVNPLPQNAWRDGAQWPAVATFVVPGWPSGLYLARVQTTGASPLTVDLPLVVRAPSGSETGILLVLSDTTQYAYNDWGGRNAYGYVSNNDFGAAYPSTSAFRVPFGFQLSFERPLHGGFGNVLQSWEIPFIRWLARRGVPVDVCTCRDLHFAQPDREKYRLLLFAGHHEYWSAQMRDSVEDFAKAGGNVAFFSGNVAWWQIRITPDGRQMICYKVAGFDPVSTTSDHAQTTVHWFDDLVKRPETALTGVSWVGNDGLYYDQDHLFTVKHADSWVFAGTGLANSDTFGGYSSMNDGNIDSSVCGAETDRVQSNGPNGLNSPANYTLASIYDLVYPDLEVGTLGTFSPGGVVFNAATINWSLGLSQDDHGWNEIDQITLNVLAKLGPPRPGPWSSVSEGSTPPGAPVAAVLASQAQVSLFLSDPEGGVYTISGDASQGWGLWTSVSQGSTAPGAPITAVLSAPNQITLFLSDPEGGIYTASGFGDQWGQWTSVSQGASTPGAPVTAVLSAPNRIALFLSDPEGGIYTASGFGDQWGQWTSVSQGASTPGAPIAAVLSAPNRIALFLSDPGGGIYTASGFGDQWGQWTSVSQGASTPGAPIAAVLSAPNQIALFLSDPEGGIYTTAGAADSWRPWTSVSEGRSTPGAPVSAVLNGDGRIRLFVADAAGTVISTLGRAAQVWQPWAAVSEGKTTPGGRVEAILASPSSAALFLSDPGGGVFTCSVPLP